MVPRVPRPTLPPDTIWFGGHPNRTAVCLRVCGDSLDPDEVTRILGRAPTRSQRKGQPVLSASGDFQRITQIGSWLLDQPVGSDGTLEEEIESLFEGLPQDAQTWAALSEQYRVDLICDVFVKGANQGFVLSPRILELLGRRQITLGIDIFCEPDEVQQKGLQERFGTKKSELDDGTREELES